MNFPPLNEQMDLIKRGTEEILPEELLVQKIERSIKEKRPLKMNNCLCEICVKCRECIRGYESYETYDPMVTRFKDSIRTTCEKHNIYIS